RRICFSRRGESRAAAGASRVRKHRAVAPNGGSADGLSTPALDSGSGLLSTDANSLDACFLFSNPSTRNDENVPGVLRARILCPGPGRHTAAGIARPDADGDAADDPDGGGVLFSPDRAA